MKNERNNYINSVNLNADSDFPYLVLDVVGDQSYPRNPGFQVMHWHEDLQFIYSPLLTLTFSAMGNTFFRFSL